MMRSRVIVADDHPSMLERIVTMLSTEHEIVAAVTNGQAAVDAAKVLQPDVVILDISMPLLSGLEVAARLVNGHETPRIVFLTVHEDPEFVEAARSVGARGYVLKKMLIADLLPTVRLVLDGQQAFPAMTGSAAHR
jgi:DNA-binding NarL/FixJ family response regulator